MSTVDERIAAREERERVLREKLLAIGLDGPHEIRTGDPLSFLAGTFTYAICLECGSLVKLDDPEPSEGDPEVMIERSVRLHTLWHRSTEARFEELVETGLKLPAGAPLPGPEPRCALGNDLKFHTGPCGAGCEYPEILNEGKS